MAKQWFNYIGSSTGFAAQITVLNYMPVGAYPGNSFCVLADRTCLIYSYTSSGSPALPSIGPTGPPGLSTSLVRYISANFIGPIVPQPVGPYKKYLYVTGL